jgi:class 3 adenylate cyclase
MSVIDPTDAIGRAPGGRKLIAVVCADMVGYSRLIELDDLGTLERLRVLRRALIDPTINEYGGRIVQTAGDSLLVVFDSIDGAIRCAVTVQQQVPHHDCDRPADQTIRFRIGINIGDAIANGTDLHGEVVNVAARLEAICPPEGICVTRAVRDHVHGRLDLVFEELGALSKTSPDQAAIAARHRQGRLFSYGEAPNQSDRHRFHRLPPGIQAPGPLGHAFPQSWRHSEVWMPRRNVRLSWKGLPTILPPIYHSSLAASSSAVPRR